MKCSSSNDYLQNFCKKPKMCTDPLCLFLFIIFWILLIVISVISITYGNYLAFVNGYDSFGNICGIKYNKEYENFSLSGADTSKKPYVLFLSSWNIEKNQSVRICAEDCINEYLYCDQDLFEEWNLTKVQYCRYDFSINKLVDDWGYTYTNRLGPCPEIVARISEPVKGRCIPLAFEYEFNEVKNIYSALDTGSGFAQLFFIHIYLGCYYIVALCGFALVVSIILLVIMRWLPNVASWLICVLVIMTNAALCAELWNTCNLNIIADNKFMFYYSFEDYFLNKTAVYIFAIISSIITAMLIIVIVLFSWTFKRTNVIFKEAAVHVTKLTELLIIPMAALIGLAAFFLVWSYVVLCITTATYIQINQFINNTGPGLYDDSFRSFERVDFVDAKSIQGLLWIFIVGFIWITEFIFACEQFCLDAAVAHWYFKTSISSPTKHAVGILLKYHMGTAAMGSFFITLFKTPRLILSYLFTILKIAEGRGYFFFKDCKLDWIRNLHHNAYVLVAMKTIDFCPAARTAWNKMTTNGEPVRTINNTTDLVFFLAKLLVASLTCLIAFLSLKHEKQLYFYMAPVILSSVFAFYIAHVVLSLFEMVIDTLLICVCMDQTNGGRGRWVNSNIAALFSSPEEIVRQDPIEVVAICCITRQLATGSIN